MTWSDFKAAVMVLLTTDANRLNISTPNADGSPTYVDLMIKQAVIDLQSFIQYYRIGQETIYDCSDFVTDGAASRGVLPPGANVRDMEYYDTNADCGCSARWPVAEFPWVRRQDLICAREPLTGSQALIAIDPQGYTFWIYPEVCDGRKVSITWDGTKTDWQEIEDTPLDEEATLAVAEFVKGKVVREVERNVGLSQSYMTSYFGQRTRLFLDKKGKSRIRSHEL